MGYNKDANLADKKVQRMVKVRRPVTAEEEARILAFLFEGRTAYSIGKIVGRDRGCIMRVADKHRRELSEDIQQKLKFGGPSIADGYDAYTRYLQSEQRQRVLSETLDKIQRMIQRPNMPAKDVRDLCVSIGIVVDKFAVETGKTDDTAKAALIAMFQKMEQNVTVNVNESSSSGGEASEVHTIEAEET
jgi:hypothetical protein